MPHDLQLGGSSSKLRTMGCLLVYRHCSAVLFTRLSVSTSGRSRLSMPTSDLGNAENQGNERNDGYELDRMAEQSS